MKHFKHKDNPRCVLCDERLAKIKRRGTYNYSWACINPACCLYIPIPDTWVWVKDNKTKVIKYYYTKMSSERKVANLFHLHKTTIHRIVAQ